jgi:hypothetical protein
LRRAHSASGITNVGGRSPEELLATFVRAMVISLDVDALEVETFDGESYG